MAGVSEVSGGRESRESEEFSEILEMGLVFMTRFENSVFFRQTIQHMKALVPQLVQS